MSLFDHLRIRVNSQAFPVLSEAEEQNAALLAYFQTFPQKQRLQAHLERLERLDRHHQIEVKLQIALKSTVEYLYAQPEGVSWSEQFEAELFKHVASSCPWLSK